MEDYSNRTQIPQGAAVYTVGSQTGIYTTEETRPIGSDHDLTGDVDSRQADEVRVNRVRAGSLTGRPVVSILTGRKLGVVDDLAVDPDNLSIAALIVSSGGLFARDSGLIPSGSVRVWGVDVILVDDEQGGIQSRLPNSERWHSIHKHLNGRPVVTMDGTRVGQIEDVALDPSGSIVGYYLSQVYQEGRLKNSRLLSSAGTQALGRDVLVMRTADPL